MSAAIAIAANTISVREKRRGGGRGGGGTACPRSGVTASPAGGGSSATVSGNVSSSAAGSASAARGDSATTSGSRSASRRSGSTGSGCGLSGGESGAAMASAAPQDEHRVASGALRLLQRGHSITPAAVCSGVDSRAHVGTTRHGKLRPRAARTGASLREAAWRRAAHHRSATRSKQSPCERE